MRMWNLMQMGVIMIGGGKKDSIGEKIVNELQDKGYSVILLDQDFDPECKAEYQIYCDLIESDDIVHDLQLAVDYMKNSEIALCGVVYAAGYNRIGAVDDYQRYHWDKTIHLNLTAVWLVASNLMYLQKEQDNQRVFSRANFDEGSFIPFITLGSNTGNIAKTKSFAYAASKAGVQHLSRTMHRELAPRGWSFITLDFGIVLDSGMTEGTYKDLERERGWDADTTTKMLLQNVPNKQAVSRQELANYVNFLLNNPISAGGNSIRLDGGQQQG